MAKTKICSRCKKRKRIESFGNHARTKDGLQYWCRSCTSEQRRARQHWRNTDYEEGRRTAAVRDRQKDYVRRLRQQALDVLGRVCVRCGFDDECALQIDHVNGGGTAEVRKLGPPMMYRRVIAGIPGYQLLCANCNWIKRCENGEVPEYRDRRIT